MTFRVPTVCLGRNAVGRISRATARSPRYSRPARGLCADGFAERARGRQSLFVSASFNLIDGVNDRLCSINWLCHSVKGQLFPSSSPKSPISFRLNGQLSFASLVLIKELFP